MNSFKVIVGIGLLHICIQHQSVRADGSKENPFQLNGQAAEEVKTVVDHPEVVFFKKRRLKAMKDERYPRYHYLAPDGFMGDPNGLSYWDGNWHLFYQYYNSTLPHAKDYDFPNHKAAFWGHAVSPDLIHWTDLPVTFKSRYQTGRCFSGGALVESDRVLAAYINTGMGAEVAEARDPLLLDWKYLGNDPNLPALPFNSVRGDRVKVENITSTYSVWDPCLFNRGDTYYLLGGGTKGYLPDRKDLFSKQKSRPKTPHWTVTATKDPQFKSWEYAGDFLEEDRFSNVYDDGSCNYFWPIGKDKDLLAYFSHMSGTYLVVGSFDEVSRKFPPVYKRKACASTSSSTPDPDDREKVILITMHNTNLPTRPDGWRLIYSLPRRYGLDERDELTVEPAGSIESLRGEMRTLPGTPLTVPHTEEAVLEGIEGNVMELELELDPGKAAKIHLDVLRSPDAKEYTRISLTREGTYVPDKGGWPWTLRIDDARSRFQEGYIDMGPRATQFFVFKGDKKTFTLRVFLDVSMVEVFVNDKVHLAQRVHPLLPESKEVSVHAVDGAIDVLGLKAWQMQSIWPEG